MMKIKDITLSNFSKYDQVQVSFDDNVTYLVGKNGSGKSTLGLTAIWFMFCGIAEKASGGNSPLIGERFRFIGPKAATAKGEMTLYDEKTMAEIKVFRKLSKTGTEVSFQGPEGLELDQKWLTDLFNVFLISPKMFCDLSPKEQAKALGIDTSSFDAEIASLKKKYTEINAVYNSFGELLEVEKVEKVDVVAFQAQKEEIRQAMAVVYRENLATNKATRDRWQKAKDEISQEVSVFNNNLQREKIAREKILEIADTIQVSAENLPTELEALVDYSKLLEHIRAWEPIQQPKDAAALFPPEPTNLADRPEGYIPEEGELVYIREIPDDTKLREIDAQILEAGTINESALLYEQYLEKKAKKEAKKAELADNKKAQVAKEEERVAYIKKFKFPFSNLTVGEDGELLLAGKPIKEPYFSTGEILKVVPILLSTANPDLKYVFLQDFTLMDEDKQREIEEYLTGKGFQLVVEVVGKSKIAEKNCILLKDNIVVEDYETSQQPTLAL